jgi:hypothetical protein
LGRVCRDWERAAHGAEVHRVRVACLRTGVVLGPGGGALARLRRPFEWFVGGRLGHGRQWVSWIHLADVVAAYLAAIDDARYAGAVNLVAPQATRNRDLAHAIGKAFHRPSFVPVPAFVVRLAAGELAEYLLHGRRAVPRKLEQCGFVFLHPTLESALAAR